MLVSHDKQEIRLVISGHETSLVLRLSSLPFQRQRANLEGELSGA
jgi:hypothetical protein